MGLTAEAFAANMADTAPAASAIGSASSCITFTFHLSGLGEGFTPCERSSDSCCKLPVPSQFTLQQLTGNSSHFIAYA